jgi:hypothetical protein
VASSPNAPDNVLIVNTAPDENALAAFNGGITDTAMELGPDNDSFDVDNSRQGVYLAASESGR